MKKIVYFITAVLACGSISFAQAVVPAFAANTLGGQKLLNATNKIEEHKQEMSSKSADKSANQLDNIKSRADALIMNRLDSLNELLNRVQNDSRLTTPEKSSLTQNIQQSVSGLTTLKAKIDADTNVTTARADAKTIITGYYVYAVFEPKIRLLVTLNNLQTTAGYVQALVPQLQNVINNVKSQGKDTTQLQQSLDDVSTQLKTINTTLISDITAVQNISTTTKRNSQDFSKVQQDIAQIVRSGFAKIRADFASMRPEFKQEIGSVSVTPGTPTNVPPTETVSVTPTTSPAPTQ